MSGGKLNRRAAVRLLHDRHPRVVDAPGDEIDAETFHLGLFRFQTRVCAYVDRRSDRSARRAFDTVHELLTRGDREVVDAVRGDFVQPHLVFHPDLDWARQRMPPLVAEVFDTVQKSIDDEFGPDAPSGSGT